MTMILVARLLPVALLCLALTCCIDDTTAAQLNTSGDGSLINGSASGPGGTTNHKDALLIVATDYESTSLSWLDPSTFSLISKGFLHSGSAVSASGAALSGDVVAGSEGLADGRFPVLDRSHSSLIWVGQEKITQWPLSDGFQANPQDVWRAGEGVVVVRAQPDPTPSSNPLSGGDDLLFFSADGVPTGRLPLTAEATLAGAMAFAGRGAKQSGLLWLPLASLARDFSAIGAARVVAVHLLQRKVTRRIDIPELQNCTTIKRAGVNLIGTCSGFFQAKERAQQAGSGIYLITAKTGAVRTILRGDSIGGAVGFPLATDGDKRGWFIRLGQLSQPARPDEVWRFNLQGEAKPKRIWRGSRGFALGGLWYDSKRQRLWVSDAADTGGDLIVLDVGPNQEGALITRIRTQPGGLPAVHLAPRRSL